MGALHRVCVFCGSSLGAGQRYSRAASALASVLVAEGITIVYGGAHVGLMGVLADAALGAGGRVIGVIPASLVEIEIAHRGLTELHVVDSIHERKAMMTELADGFVALPGGFGTLEETFEVLTAAQVGLHTKPVGMLDVDGYYGALETFLDHAVAEGLMKVQNRHLLMVDDDATRLVRRLTG